MVCNKCGSQIDSDSKFCPVCGRFVEEISNNPSPEVKEMDPPYGELGSFNQEGKNEKVVWVLSAQVKESLFKRKPSYLIFMEDKLLVAFLSPQRQKEESAKVSSDVKAQGKGFLKSSAAIMQHWSNYYKKYYSMTSADILAEESENYAIEYGDINKILYRSETTDTDSDGQNYGHQGKIEISLSNGNKIKFTHTHHHDKKIKIMLLELFEEKLKYKK